MLNFGGVTKHMFLHLRAPHTFWCIKIISTRIPNKTCFKKMTFSPKKNKMEVWKMIFSFSKSDFQVVAVSFRGRVPSLNQKNLDTKSLIFQVVTRPKDSPNVTYGISWHESGCKNHSLSIQICPKKVTCRLYFLFWGWDVSTINPTNFREGSGFFGICNESTPTISSPRGKLRYEWTQGHQTSYSQLVIGFLKNHRNEKLSV